VPARPARLSQLGGQGVAAGDLALDLGLQLG
jgi:hypothetical protein